MKMQKKNWIDKFWTIGENLQLTSSLEQLNLYISFQSQDSLIHVGSSLAVKKNGNYTLCVSGGRADCLNSSISPCASIAVTGLDGRFNLLCPND